MKTDFAVYLDGSKIGPEEAAAVIGIRVFQTRFGASAFEIVVSDPELKWQGKPTFTDCKEVKIELGVPGKLKKIFDGEITAWRTELERNGPTVLVLRGMDRSHRLMRGHKTRTYKDASPLDVVQKIASEHGLTAKTRGGSPEPVKMFRFQANESDFDFLRKMADLEGYMFWVEGSDLHFERVELSSTDDCTFTFGEDLKTFLPTANFRKSPSSVEVGAWDPEGKAEITGKAKSGDQLWTVPGGSPGADKSKFTSSKIELSIVESQVRTQAHADTVAKAALTKRALEFITAEVEVQGNPNVKPGAMVNLKKVGAYGGHYVVTEANHFYDVAGYHCIFYVARDKWGDSSNDHVKDPAGSGSKSPGGGPTNAPPFKPPKPKADPKDKKSYIDFTLQDDAGKVLTGVKVKIHLASGATLDATTDASGRVHLDEEPAGTYTVEVLGAAGLTNIDLKVEDSEGNPVTGASGKVKLSDGTEVVVMTDAQGEVHLTDVPEGDYKFTLDEKTATLIEVEDAHFRLDSAIFLPEPATDTGADAPPSATIVGLDTLKTIYLRMKEFPDEKVLVTGHTDTKGADAYNQPLSEQRAGSVAALLTGDRDAFAKVSHARHQPKDAQQILTWAARVRHWDCDPDGIDGDIGAKTQAAIKSFKKHAAAELESGVKEDAKIDAPFWTAVFDVYLAELAKLLEIETTGLAGFRGALKWVDDKRPCVGCGESWPIEAAGKDNFRSATNRRVEVLFFEPGQEPKLDCHPSPGKCEKSKCELFAPGKYDRKPLPVHPNPRPQSRPLISVPQEPGSSTFLHPDGLHAYLVSFKGDALDRVSHLVVRGGQLTLPGGGSAVSIDCDREAFFYFSHRDDLADDASARPARFKKDRSGLPLVGPLMIPCGAGVELKVDLWAQNDWVMFRARQLDAASPDAVRMVEWREDYQLGEEAFLKADGKRHFWIYGTPQEKDKQELWKGATGMIDLTRMGTVDGAPLMIGTLSVAPSGNLKVVALKGGNVVASWNELAAGKANIELPGMHKYDKTLVAKLAALKDSDQGNAALDALPNPPARFLLPGDMNWQTQGETNFCGAYSFASAMNYWFPYTNHVGARDGAWYADTSRVPSVVNGARTPANIVEGANRFHMNGRDNDAEKLDKSRALKLLKLWVMAGIPTLVLVKEDSAAGPIGRLMSYHWKVVTGWDGDRLFMNNSGGDQEWDMSLRKPGFDYEHGPTGNDMDPIDTHWEKWKAAGGDIVDFFTSVDECTFIPLYPTGPEFAGDRVR